MEKLYRILKIFLWCAIRIFVGQSIYQCYDYYARPGLYASTLRRGIRAFCCRASLPNHCAFDVACHVDDSEETIKKMSVEKNKTPIIKQPKRKNAFITEWKYPMNMRFIIPYRMRNRKKRGFGFANPANHFYSFYDETKLVGFINLYEEKKKSFSESA